MALDTGVTTWLMVSALLVMLMTPGVGFFYGGLVRKKNFISMIALSFLVLALTSIQWILVGYSLAFGSDIGGVIGSLQYPGAFRCECQCRHSCLPAAGLHGLPALLCLSYTDHRDLCSRREGQTDVIYRICTHLADRCVLPACTLGMGWRLGAADGADRLCGRDGCRDLLGICRTCVGPCDREKGRLWRVLYGTS